MYIYVQYLYDDSTLVICDNMKNMKKNTIAIGTIACFLGIMLVPCIDATILEGKTVEAIAKNDIVNEEYIAEETGNDIEPTDCGSIYGSTGYLKGWGVYGLPFVVVEAKVGDTLIEKDRSNIKCRYKLSKLSTGSTYTIIASSDAVIEKDGGYYGFYDCTKIITLTEDKSNEKVDFTLEINYDDPVKTRNLYAFEQLVRFSLFARLLKLL